MKIAFLHTLAANQSLFESFISPSGLETLASVHHHSAPQLLQYASTVGIDEELTSMVEQQVLQLEAQGADWVVCTCSSIGALAERATTRFAQVLRVDRPMVAEASLAAKVKVLAALSTTIEPTMNLLAEYDTDAETNTESAQRVTVEVIPDAWPHYLAGDNEAYLTTIAH